MLMLMLVLVLMLVPACRKQSHSARLEMHHLHRLGRDQGKELTALRAGHHLLCSVLGRSHVLPMHDVYIASVRPDSKTAGHKTCQRLQSRRHSLGSGPHLLGRNAVSALAIIRPLQSRRNQATQAVELPALESA